MAKEKISYKEIIKNIKPEMERHVDVLEKDLQNLRTSRVSPALIENIEVEVFGQQFHLKQLGAILGSGSRELSIQVWDNSYVEPILKALEKKSLGVNPIVEKNLIRVVFPPLSEEFRKELLKLLSQKKEETRQKIRRVREEAWGTIQKNCREGKLSEDDKYKGKEELQKIIEECNEKIEKLAFAKEKEILE